MSFSTKHPIGSEGWFKGESQYSTTGTFSTCLQLLLQEEITLAKCRELLEIASNPFDTKINWHGGIKAPWDKLNWNADVVSKYDSVTEFLEKTRSVDSKN